MTIQTWISQYFDKANEYVFITGASTGIGFEYLQSFASEGCRCVVLSNDESIHLVARETSAKFNVEVVPLQIDLADLSQVTKLSQQLNSFKITVVINNAGFGYKGDFLDMKTEMIVNMINVNSVAPTLISHDLVRKLRNYNKGFVVTVATINIATPIAKNCIYTASKFYSYAFSMAMTKENEDKDIYFQTLLPGTTDTPFHVKQGAKPSALTMIPKDVSDYSLSHVDKVICIPNRTDRYVFPFFSRIPILFRMKLASFILKKRLGV